MVFRKKFKKITKEEVFRYIIGGLGSLLISFGIIFILIELFKFHYMIGTNLSVIAVLIYSYLMNKYIVFRNHKSDHVKQGTKFIFLQMFLWGLANIILYAGVDILNINYYLVMIFIAGFMAILNFSLLRLAVFN